MSDPAQRRKAGKSPAKPAANSSLRTKDRVPTQVEDAGRVISVLDILRIVLIIALVPFALSYYMTSGDSWTFGYKPWFIQPAKVAQYFRGPLQLTPEQLLEFDGTNTNKPIYLAINGSIFDVSQGRHTYGPGGGYEVFAGRDATRAFVTGCFLEDRTSDLRGAEEVYIPIDSPNEQISSGERKTRAERERRQAKKRVLQEVAKWESFYRDSKKYFEVGKLVGVPKHSGPAPSLCAAAQNGRPKRKSTGATSADAMPGKPVQ